MDELAKMVSLFEKLVKLVHTGKKMRNAQKEYFKERAQYALVASKQLEKEFDALLAEIEGLLK